MNSDLEKLKKLYHCLVTVDTNQVYTKEVGDRFNSMNNTPVFELYKKNVDKLIAKIPKLMKMKYVIRNKDVKPLSIKWIDDWFNRITFSDKSILHSIPDNLKMMTLISHNIILLYAINNKNVIIHGSYISHIINPSVRYADIDLTTLSDELIYLTSFLLYIFLNLNTIIFSIPYIINHRQLRLSGNDTSISDAMKIDSNTLYNCQSYSVKFQKDIYLNTQNPAIQFFNYFKMLHIPERRMKMRHYADNQLKIITTITSQFMKSIPMTQQKLQTVTPLNFSMSLEPDSIILMTIDNHPPIYFHTLNNDAGFISGVLEYKGEEHKGSTVILFNQMASIFPEQRLELYGNKKVEMHINLSRNEVYSIVDSSVADNIAGSDNSSVPPRIATISVLNMLSILGLHHFFTRNFDDVNTEYFIKIARTIIAVCEMMTNEDVAVLYPRLKNKGFHITRNIKDKNLYIPNVNKYHFIEKGFIDSKGDELKINEGMNLKEYYQFKYNNPFYK